jgi:hypothetical protein
MAWASQAARSSYCVAAVTGQVWFGGELELRLALCHFFQSNYSDVGLSLEPRGTGIGK